MTRQGVVENGGFCRTMRRKMADFVVAMWRIMADYGGFCRTIWRKMAENVGFCHDFVCQFSEFGNGKKDD